MDMIIPATNLTFAQLFTLIFSGTFGLMGAIFLAVGLGFQTAVNRKRSLCTAYTEGTVSAMQTQFGSTSLRAVYSFPSTESLCNTFPATRATAICSSAKPSGSTTTRRTSAGCSSRRMRGR